MDIMTPMRSANRPLAPSSTALIVIDMQHDFCSSGYYMDKAGYDVAKLRKPIVPIQRALSAARQNGMVVIFTRQHGKPDRVARRDNPYPRIALKGEPGWELIAELQPTEDEAVLDKTACSAFVSTDLHELLMSKGVRTLVFCGNTIDVCVHSTLRSANDLSYDCITLSDGCGAVNDELHHWSLESIKVEHGVFGEVMTAQEFIGSIQHQ